MSSKLMCAIGVGILRLPYTLDEFSVFERHGMRPAPLRGVLKPQGLTFSAGVVGRLYQ
jgi:hypothetical protein